MSAVQEFDRDDVPQWESGLIRWCIIEVFLCVVGIAVVNYLEFSQKK
jgi:hypothetical protein